MVLSLNSVQNSLAKLEGIDMEEIETKSLYTDDRLARRWERERDNALVELEILGGENATDWVQKAVFPTSVSNMTGSIPAV